MTGKGKAKEVEIVPNDDRLRRKLGVTSHTPLAVDPERLAEAEKAIAQLESSYRDWLGKDLAALTEEIEGVARDPANAAPHLQAARKLLHDIRGQGGTFNFELITTLADSLHAVVKSTEAPDARLIQLMRVHLDALKVVHEKELKGDGGEEGRAMRQVLALAVAKLA